MGFNVFFESKVPGANNAAAPTAPSPLPCSALCETFPHPRRSSLNIHRAHPLDVRHNFRSRTQHVNAQLHPVNFKRVPDELLPGKHLQNSHISDSECVSVYLLVVYCLNMTGIHVQPVFNSAILKLTK